MRIANLLGGDLQAVRQILRAEVLKAERRAAIGLMMGGHILHQHAVGADPIRPAKIEAVLPKRPVTQAVMNDDCCDQRDRCDRSEEKRPRESSQQRTPGCDCHKASTAKTGVARAARQWVQMMAGMQAATAATGRITQTK